MTLHTRVERLERTYGPEANTPQMRANAAKVIDFDYDEFARIFAELYEGQSDEQRAAWEEGMAEQRRCLAAMEARGR